MTKEEISNIIYNQHPITYHSVKITFSDGRFIIAYFDLFDDSDELEEKNQWRVIENNHQAAYRSSGKDKAHTTVISGYDVESLQIL